MQYIEKWTICNAEFEEILKEREVLNDHCSFRFIQSKFCREKKVIKFICLFLKKLTSMNFKESILFLVDSY